MSINKKEILYKLTQKLKLSPLPVISAAVYGSFLKDTFSSDSDIDLLIIAENINPIKHRRNKEISKLKIFLSIGIPLDIFLLTRSECESNFRNHNPLFLDIASESVVLIDHNEFLIKLIEETKTYIKERGLTKLSDGWKFPVKYREVTYLSSVSNKDFAFAMLKDGERDFKIGETLIKEEFFDKAIYHFQQSAEKSIKAILICFGEFKKTHFISDSLIEKLNNSFLDDNWKNKLDNIAKINLEIEPEVTWSRYPGIDQGKIWLPYEEYSLNDAINVRDKCDIIVKTAIEFVTWWFKNNP